MRDRLGLEVEAFRKAMCGCSSLGCRVRVGKMCRDRELEISEILLMVDPRDWGVTAWQPAKIAGCEFSQP